MEKITLGLDAEDALKKINKVSEYLGNSERQAAKTTQAVIDMFKAIDRSGQNVKISDYMGKFTNLDSYVKNARKAFETIISQRVQDLKSVIKGVETLNGLLGSSGMSGKSPLTLNLKQLRDFQNQISSLYGTQKAGPIKMPNVRVAEINATDKGLVKKNIVELIDYIDKAVSGYVSSTEKGIESVVSSSHNPFTKTGKAPTSTKKAIIEDLSNIKANTIVRSKDDVLRGKSNFQAVTLESPDNTERGLLKKAEHIRNEIERKEREQEQIAELISRNSFGGVLARSGMDIKKDSLEKEFLEHQKASFVDVKTQLKRKKDGSYEGVPAGNLKVYAKDNDVRMVNSILMDELNKENSSGAKAKLLAAYDDAKRVLIEKLTNFVTGVKDSISAGKEKISDFIGKASEYGNSPSYSTSSWKTRKAEKESIERYEMEALDREMNWEIDKERAQKKRQEELIKESSNRGDDSLLKNSAPADEFKRGEKDGERYQQGFEQGRKKKGGSERGTRWDNEYFRKDQEWRRRNEERTSAAYERMSLTAWENARYKRDNEDVDRALKAARTSRAFYGNVFSSGREYGSLGEAWTGERLKSFRSGVRGRFDLLETLGNALMFRGESSGADRALKKFADKSGAILKTEAVANSKELQDFIDKRYPSLGVLVKEGAVSGKEAMRKLTDEDKKDFLGELRSWGNRRSYRNIKKDALKDKVDKSILMGEAAQTPGTMQKIARGAMMGALPITGLIAFGKAVTWAGEQAKKLGKDLIDSYKGIQTLQTQLGVVFGSNVQSDAMFQQIAEFAKRSPVGVETQTAQAVLLKQSGVYAADLMDTMKRLTDLSSGNDQRMKSLSEVYARVMSSTTVTARDMRQLANAGVPSYAALADATGYERGQIRSKLQSGKITSEDFQKMIKVLTDEGGMFYNATEIGAKTIAARQQNLQDARQLAAAAAGERVAKLGGTTIQDSFYGKYLTFMEKFYDMVETNFHVANSDKREKAYEKAVKQYEKAKQDGASQEELEKMAASIKGLYGESLAAGSDKYSKMEEIFGKNFTEDDIKERVRKINYLTMYGGRDYKDSLEVYELRGGLSKWNFNRLIRNYQNAVTGHNQKLLSEEMQQSNKNIDSMINYSKGGQMAMANARKEWEAGELGKYRQAVEEENRAYEWRAKYAEFERNTYDRETDTHDLSRLNLTELLQVSDFIYSATDSLRVELQDLLTPDESGLAMGAGEELKALGENYDVLLKSIENTDSENLTETANQIKLIMEILNGDWSKDAGDKAKKLADLMANGLPNAAKKEYDEAKKALDELVSEATDEERKAAQKRVDIAEAAVKGIQNATQKAEISTKDAEYLNKRKQAPAWAQLLAKTTGIDANSIIGTEGRAGLKGAGAMRDYTTNISQRQMFSSVGKALLQQGTSLKELSGILGKYSRGTDSQGRGLFNWTGATGALEQYAMGMNSETQQALISAYDAQINALDELTVGSIVTADTWDELKNEAKYLGTAFTLSAQRMSDGSMQFTESTVRAANEMREALSARKLSFDIAMPLAKEIERLKEETSGGKLRTAALKGYLSGTGGFDTEKRESYAKNVQDSLKAIGKSSGTDLLNAAMNHGKTGDLIALLNRVLGTDYTATVEKAQGTKEVDFKKATFDKAVKWANDNLGSMRDENGRLYDVNELIEKYLKDSYPDTRSTRLRVNGSGEATGAYWISNNAEEKSVLKLNGKETTSEQLAESVKTLAQNAVNGEVEVEDMDEVISLLKILSEPFAQGLADWKMTYDENRETQKQTEAASETSTANDRIRRIFSERGIFGENAAYRENSKAFSQMSGTNLLNSYLWNSPTKERYLQMMGMPETANYDEVMKREAQAMTPETWGGDDYYMAIGKALRGKNLGHFLNAPEHTVAEKGIDREFIKYLDDEISKVSAALSDGIITDDDIENFEHLTSLLGDVDVSIEDIKKSTIEWANSQQLVTEEFQALASAMKNGLRDFTSGSVLNVSKKFGEDMYQIWVYEKDQQKAIEGINKGLAAEGARLLDTISAQLVDTGLKIAANGAVSGSLPQVAGGLALAALGGLGSFASGLLSGYSSDNQDDKTDDSLERLSRLKDNLADLLKQARDDAKYYEETLRAKKAIATTDAMSATSVNDMILTPQGKFSTAPDDYIMAMKDPTSLRGGSSPSVTVQIVNESGTRLNATQTRQSTDGFGNINLEVVVNSMVKKAMAGGEYDEAFAAAQYSQRGTSTYA